MQLLTWAHLLMMPLPVRQALRSVTAAASGAPDTAAAAVGSEAGAAAATAGTAGGGGGGGLSAQEVEAAATGNWMEPGAVSAHTYQVWPVCERRLMQGSGWCVASCRGAAGTFRVCTHCGRNSRSKFTPVPLSPRYLQGCRALLEGATSLYRAAAGASGRQAGEMQVRVLRAWEGAYTHAHTKPTLAAPRRDNAHCCLGLRSLMNTI